MPFPIWRPANAAISFQAVFSAADISQSRYSVTALPWTIASVMVASVGQLGYHPVILLPAVCFDGQGLVRIQIRLVDDDRCRDFEVFAEFPIPVSGHESPKGSAQ